MEDLEVGVIIDTDVVIDYLKRRPDRVATEIFHKIKVGELSANLTSISAFELYRGARLSPEPKERVGEVKAILRNVKCLPFDEAAADLASEMYISLERTGEPLEIRDLFIGALTRSVGLTLVTRNLTHFKRLPNLKATTPQDLLRIL